MNREAGWVATMLAGLLLLMTLLAPARVRGQLPSLEEAERPAPVVYHVPLVGPIIRQVQRMMVVATWQLEAIPTE